MIFRTRSRFAKAAAGRAPRHNSVTAIVFLAAASIYTMGCGILQQRRGELEIRHAYMCDMYLKLLNGQETILHTSTRARGRKFLFGSRFSTEQSVVILVSHKLQGKKKLTIARYDGICGEWYCHLISSTHRSIRLTEELRLSSFGQWQVYNISDLC